ncbi:thiamine pyrophosphate-binding protein [Shinella sp.]|uniref:thiamine pyrophosphate-binding protein n=1 Tax=Shinella sp. TaxID=1870904 RepID=UPI0029AC729C|nr:thiamine pyrophosphate-binding protein [Shinella sp.]MDX3977433.1 thiamine pyrophosphate-binding protein [Shinella sp.]
MANASDILVDTLIEWGVDVVFGLPGDGINGIMEALRTRQDRIRFVQVRHEASAAFMASGYARATGKLGVCLATSGPGGTNLLTGLYDAKLDQLPVLAVTGMQFHDLLHTFTQQDVDLTRVFNDVALYNATVHGAVHMQNVASLACRSALTGRGVAHLSIANDTQEQSVEEGGRSRRNKPGHAPNRRFPSRSLPDQAQLDHAVDLLNGAERVAILAGRGALGARGELARAADLLAAPVAKALLGKTVMADTHPHCTGGIGILGTAPSQKIMKDCDALLIVGSSFPYIEYYPEPGKARAVQIDTNGQRIGLRYPVEAGLVGDAGETLRLLNERLQQKSDRSFLRSAQRDMVAWREKLGAMEEDTASPLKPAAVVKAFGTRIAENGILVTDSGQNTELGARHIDLGLENDFAVSGALASMASAIPFAVAAGIAHPHRPLYAVVGDGGLAMQLGEFSTAVRQKLPLKVLVLRNEMLNQIAWEQMMFLGNPQFACELAPINFAMAAEAMGARGFTIETPAQIETVLDAAFSIEGPVLIQAKVDRYEPMLPPILPADYARNLEKALPETPGASQIRNNIARSPLVDAGRFESSGD